MKPEYCGSLREPLQPKKHKTASGFPRPPSESELAVFLFGGRLRSAELIDDRAVTIHSAREAAQRRRELIRYIWGADGFPARRMPIVTTNIPSPVKDLAQLERVGEFRVDMAPGVQGLAYHLRCRDDPYR